MRVLAKPRLIRNDDDIGYLLRVLRNTFVSRGRASARRPVTAPMPELFEPVDPRSGTRPDEAAAGATRSSPTSRRCSPTSATP